MSLNQIPENSITVLVREALVHEYLTVESVLTVIAHMICFILGMILYIAYINLQRNMLSDRRQSKKYIFRWRVAMASGVVNCAVTPMLAVMMLGNHGFSAICFISVVVLVVTHTLGAWGMEKAVRTWTNVWVSVTRREKLNLEDISEERLQDVNKDKDTTGEGKRETKGTP